MTFLFKYFHITYGRKGNIARRSLFMLFLLLSPMACAPLSQPTSVVEAIATEAEPVTSTATVTPVQDMATPTAVVMSETPTVTLPISSEPLIFIAEADARVQQSDPDTNYGEGE